MDVSAISRISRVTDDYSIDAYSKLPDNSVNSTKSLSVVIKDFIDKGTATSSQLDVISSILQSICESMANTINNMVMTPEERRAVEEKRAKIEKLREDVKERKIDEREARIELGRLLAEEDKKALEFIISERIIYS